MIMKNLHINMAFIFVLLLITASCSDKDDSAPRVIPTMNLIVSEIADNTALITSEQQTGTTFGAKVIEFYPVADIGFDYNIEVKLVKFVGLFVTPWSIAHQAPLFAEFSRQEY